MVAVGTVGTRHALSLPIYRIIMGKSLAIDIGVHSIKLIELQGKKNQLELTKCAKNLVSKDDIKSSLKDLAASEKLSSRRVNVSLSGPSVIVRYIEMPSMNKEELSSAIKFEAEKYIPFDINDAIVDCTILDKGPSGSSRVLLVAARKDKVNSYIHMFKELGIDIATIDVDSVALLNAFQRVGLEKENKATFAIINIGAKFSNMNVISNGFPYFTRDILWGGMDVTNRIKDLKLMSLEEAEALKCKSNEKKEEIVPIAMPSLEKLVSEVRLSFDYFETQFGKNIERLYISGGSSNLYNTAVFLKDNLDIDILTWNPFEGIKIINEPVECMDAKNSHAQFAVAVGLALRGL